MVKVGGSLGQGPATEITLSWVKSTSSFFPVIVSERIIISPRLKCACNSNGKQLTYLTSVNQWLSKNTADARAKRWSLQQSCQPYCRYADVNLTVYMVYT